MHSLEIMEMMAQEIQMVILELAIIPILEVIIQVILAAPIIPVLELIILEHPIHQLQKSHWKFQKQQGLACIYRFRGWRWYWTIWFCFCINRKFQQFGRCKRSLYSFRRFWWSYRNFHRIRYHKKLKK